MTEKIQPQQGPQTQFLSTKADIAIYGGQAGGGKTFGILLEPLRHLENPLFAGLIFRRHTTEIRTEGGLWDEANNLYPKFDCTLNESSLKVKYPKGGSLKFAHLELEKTVHSYQGAQAAFIGFDELTHFTYRQFFYMLSRLRSVSGIKGYIRATCNPDADSWVRNFIDWWLDESGVADQAKSGVLRWFVRINDEIIWSDTKEELISEHGKEVEPKSVTFIPATIYDNKILMEKDPSYLSNLKALPRIDRERLLGGNWNIRPSAGLYFQRSFFPMIDECQLPPVRKKIRYWDLAGTEEDVEGKKEPAFTVGLKMSQDENKRLYIEHVERFRKSPGQVEASLINMAHQDGKETTVGISQDPGQAGKSQIAHYAKKLLGFILHSAQESGSKEVRAKPLSSTAEHGNIVLVRGNWNDVFLDEATNFPDGKFKDQIDAATGAFNFFTETKTAGKMTPSQRKSGTMAQNLRTTRTW